MLEKIKFIMSSVYELLLPVIRLFVTDAGKVLAQAATDAVATVAETMGQADGPVKREEAFKMILATLVAAGITLGKSAIYLAIEIAVAKMKASQQ